MRAQSSHDDGEVLRLGGELGLDAVGCGARRGVHGDRAAHPRAPRARPVRGHALHDGAARGVVPPGVAAARRAHRDLGRALLLGARGAARAGRRAAGALHVARQLRRAARAARRARSALGGEYRVLVDANQHVDREAAARSGVGFYGKNTMLITRRHGSWVVLGTLITDVELEPTAPLDADCGECRLCIDACPTGALDEPGTLDATKCLSYWTQAPGEIPEPYRAELGAQVYGCDICQDVCPWNRGVEKRRGGDAQTAEGHVDLRALARARRPRARARVRPPVRAGEGSWRPAAQRADRARERGRQRDPQPAARVVDRRRVRVAAGAADADSGRADAALPVRRRALAWILFADLLPSAAQLLLGGGARRRRTCSSASVGDGVRLRRRLVVRHPLHVRHERRGAAVALPARGRGRGAASGCAAGSGSRWRRCRSQRSPSGGGATWSSAVPSGCRRVPGRRRARDGAARRLGRGEARRGARRAPRRARRRGGGSARPARPARRPARRREPLRPCAQLVARPGRGVRRVHPRAPRPRAVRPHGDRARRGGPLARDRDRREQGGRCRPARLDRAARPQPARRADRERPDGVPARHGCRRATTRRRGWSRRSASAAASRRRC